MVSFFSESPLPVPPKAESAAPTGDHVVPKPAKRKLPLAEDELVVSQPDEDPEFEVSDETETEAPDSGNQVNGSELPEDGFVAKRLDSLKYSYQDLGYETKKGKRCFSLPIHQGLSNKWQRLR